MRWHHACFRLYWSCLSRHRIQTGRERISKELHDLIFRMVVENPTWGAPRIHGELKLLGFDVSERTVSRWVQRAPKDPEQRARWKAFLEYYREAITAMGFLTVPNFTCGAPYCFFILAHDRRRVLHFNVTRNPTSALTVQQLREAFPFESVCKYLIFDRDTKFGPEVRAPVKAMGSSPQPTSFQSPWQNGVAERWIESCRRDLLDHVIVLNEKHLKRLLSECVRYYHEDRTHLGLNKEPPLVRTAEALHAHSKIVSGARWGGLHHRYDLAA